ncbi:hypothetical protein PT279_01050 [Bifidobacterium sp. ESL0784]|uniref:hypothetical protein n=1 Tax=Bifidobacterium sp. ESL0784 TaxID=2983231 RepID=UPI0023F9B535|nr:hypothetical protein [Bifidobacterium sp. ESL0784]MDF7640185.1 hypothetical protein [Bifidobacterium sp. ESL0784]
MIRYYARGRFLVLSVALVVVGFCLSARYWYVRPAFYLTGQGIPTYLTLPVVVSHVCGTMAIVCVSPRLPLVDYLSVTKVRVCNTIVVGCIVLVSCIGPYIWYGLFSVVPLRMVPDYKNYITGGLRFGDAISFSLPVFCCICIAVYMAIAVISIALMGKILGVAVSFLAFIVYTLLAAAYPENEFLQGGFARSPSGAFVSLIVAAVALVASLCVWYVTSAGAPLLRGDR